MPVTNTSSLAGPFIPNGSTTIFPFAFNAALPGDVSVFDGDGETVSPGLYTVNLYEGDGGTVTFSTAPTLAQFAQLYIALVPSFAQTADFTNSGPTYNPAQLTAALDAISSRVIALKGEVGRSIKVGFGEDLGAPLGLSDRAGKFLAFDGAGNPIGASGTGADGALRSDVADVSGAALVGANDGAAGSLFGSVQGFINYLLSNGASVIGYNTNLTVAERLGLLPITPEEAGATALEDGGTTSQTNFIRDALESGRIVDGGGKTYVIGASVNPADNTVTGLQNCKFVRLAANQATQDYMIDLTIQQGVKVRNCEFDFGTLENTGSNDDSSRALLAVGRNATANLGTWQPGIVVENCTFTGAGNGTAIYARGLIGAQIIGNRVFNRVYAGTATNDAQNGIDVSWGRGNKVQGNTVDGLYTRVSGVLRPIYSRGILLTEQADTSVSFNHIYNVDQAIDVSGGISPSTLEGNRGVNIVGNVISDVRTFCIKFANCARNTLCSDNTCRNFGWAAIVASGQSGPFDPVDPTKATSFLTIQGNYIFDPSDLDGGRTDCIGIWMTYRTDFPGYPIGCRILNNTIRASAGNTRLKWGIALTDGDRLVVAGAPYNEVAGNKISGATEAPTIGCVPDGLCVLTGAGTGQAIPTSTWTSVEWDSETVDGQGLHSNGSNLELIVTGGVAGWYEVNYGVVFAADATGVRRARLSANGTPVPGSEAFQAAVSGETIPLSGRAWVYLGASSNVKVEVWHNRGSNLNINRVNSQFSARRIEQMGAS